MLDDDSLKLLRKQAKKLKDTASKLSEWHDGKYGGLRFCDTTTFTKVTRLWEFYSIDPSQGDMFSEQQQKLRHGIQEARRTKGHYVGQKKNLSGIRSAEPCSLSAFEDMAQLYEIHWKKGTPTLDDSQAKHMNPMFGSLRENLILHYGADPLHAFHLATMYTPISDRSPLKPEGAKGLNKCFKAALDQFRAWAAAFRAISQRMTIRFVKSSSFLPCSAAPSSARRKQDGLVVPRWLTL